MRRLLLSLAAFTAAGCSSGAGAHAHERADVVPPRLDSLPASRTEIVPRSVDTLPARRTEIVGRSVDTLPTRTVDSVAQPNDTLPTEFAGEGLSGAWVSGSSDEPAERRIVFHPPCNYTRGFWNLVQEGNTVRAWTIPESRAQGIAKPRGPSPTIIEGRLKRGLLVMGDRTTRYRLRYDSASGHLRGTLNGAPFWAVRLAFVLPKGCRAIP